MHKFKVGDVVRLKTVEELDEEFGDGWRERFWVMQSMVLENFGRDVTIMKCVRFWDDNKTFGYHLNEGTPWFYCESLFADTDEELEKITVEISFDDLIK
jgi:hypothetical protein